MTTTTRLGHAENAHHEDGTAVARILTRDAWFRSTHFTHNETVRAATNSLGEFAETIVHDVASVTARVDETTDGSPIVELVTQDSKGRTCYVRLFDIDALAVAKAILKAIPE